jgi:poly(A) polymerase
MTAASSKPRSAREDAVAVVRRLGEAGHVAYFAGGCVRDALLGLEPKDYDVATDAPPDRVRELFSRTQAVGAAFGVILVRQGRSQIEVATFRTDLKYVDGRRPEGVVFTTAEEDAKRRDFTINGLFYDPLQQCVIDYVGGQADLNARVLRAIGQPDHRFEEDHLRMLRAVRFAARFGLTIHPATFAAIVTHAEQLKRISPERIADELRRMLTPATRANAWELLWATGLLQVVFRVLPTSTPTAPPKDRCLFVHVAPGEPLDFGTALAAAVLTYLWQAEGGDLKQILLKEWISTRNAMRQSLRISNEEADTMEGAWAGLLAMVEDLQTVAAQKRLLQRPTSRSARALARGVAALGHDADRLRQLDRQLTELERTDFAPPPLITGDDLKAAGLAPGRAFKRALEEAYDAQLEGRVTTKEQALALGLRVARDGA